MSNERQTRQEKIDLQLGRAGWAIGSRCLLQEYLVDSSVDVKVPETPYRITKEFADFLRHILHVSSLPSRESLISEAFDEWVRLHPQLTATQLMFVRTLRKAVMQKAEISSLDALRQPPFSSIGDPEGLFGKSELDDLLELTKSVAA